MKRKYVLDLFCGAGGAAVGIDRAGFRIVGVDAVPQPNYPFLFIQDDAFKVLKRLLAGERISFATRGNRTERVGLSSIAWIWASPPCQSYSWSARRWKNGTNGHAKRKYPDLIKPMRKELQKTGLPYVIENVSGAPLKDRIMLCGQMFSLRVIRHRYFESNIILVQPEHQSCKGLVASGAALTIAGHGGHSKSYKLAHWQEAMQIFWMTKRERNLGDRKRPGNREDLCEAVPPAYSEYIARQMVT